MEDSKNSSTSHTPQISDISGDLSGIVLYDIIHMHCVHTLLGRDPITMMKLTEFYYACYCSSLYFILGHGKAFGGQLMVLNTHVT